MTPKSSLFIAYVYLLIIGSVFYLFGFYSNNTFFNWGPPIVVFTHTITDIRVFYTLHVLIFCHQIVNNMLNIIVYPWIINSVQDHKCRHLEYSTMTSLLLINLFDLFSELDVMIVIAGFSSQISFILTISIANLISGTLLNYGHIRRKQTRFIDSLIQLNV